MNCQRHASAGEGKDIELRHQRTPDVVFSCVAQQPGGCHKRQPEFCFCCHQHSFAHCGVCVLRQCANACLRSCSIGPRHATPSTCTLPCQAVQPQDCLSLPAFQAAAAQPAKSWPGRCLCVGAGGGMAVPGEAFEAIETLLPTGKGQFVELWAPRGASRPGWTHVVEVGTATWD
jgi:hypothetical protein